LGQIGHALTGIKKASRNSAAGMRLIPDKYRLEVTRKDRRQPRALPIDIWKQDLG
jgi:hypothetical protein